MPRSRIRTARDLVREIERLLRATDPEVDGQDLKIYVFDKWTVLKFPDDESDRYSIFINWDGGEEDDDEYYEEE